VIITLHFAEIYFRAPDSRRRRFDVAIEGKPRIEDYDPLARGFATAQVFTKAANWLEDMKDDGRSMLLYAECFDPHEPWEAPPKYIEKYVDPAYKGPWIIHPKMGVPKHVHLFFYQLSQYF